MGLIKRSIEAYLRKLHNQTIATMVPTYALANDLRSRGYQNVTLLSRGVELKQFSPTHRSAALRAQWGVTDETLVFLHVGRLAKEKNIGLLIAAYQACLVENPTAKLVFVGDGPMRKQLEESCPQAVFAGVQKGADLAVHYASADMFPFPSVTETFGNVVPEALASGLAVIAYDTASAKELITNGIDGTLVAVDQDLNFIRATVAMAKQSADRARMRNAAPRCVSHMGWEKIHDAFIATLRTVIDRQGVGLFTASSLPRPQPITSASA
jgi:glycosyltransferase involved in cell wall biosynthesis